MYHVSYGCVIVIIANQQCFEFLSFKDSGIRRKFQVDFKLI